jgi:pimeloyl-ACP methyl ester carboxylesterase
VELLFHGYRGNAERDLSGGVERCFSLKRNALIIDQRSSGRSDGNVITFVIKERFDCLKWVNFAIEHFGEDVQIILTGISMGAATVMMAAGEKLPKNVVCVLADCGYTSPKEILEKVIHDMKLPVWLVMPFVKLGARLFGDFNLEETSPIEAVKHTNIPLILIHGEADDFIPWQMSKRIYDHCNSKKSFVTIPNAGHGLAFPVDKQAYLQALLDFEKEWRY